MGHVGGLSYVPTAETKSILKRAQKIKAKDLKIGDKVCYLEVDEDNYYLNDPTASLVVVEIKVKPAIGVERNWYTPVYLNDEGKKITLCSYSENSEFHVLSRGNQTKP